MGAATGSMLSTPSRRCSSTIASRPVPSMSSAALRARSGSRSRIRRAPPACTTMTLIECATTSCISRAIRRRSSTTACSAAAALRSLARAAASWSSPAKPRPAARRPPGDAERDDEDHGEQHVGDHQRPVDRGRRHRPGEEDAQAREGAAAVRVRAQAEGEGQQREPDRRQLTRRRQPGGQHRGREEGRGRRQGPDAPPGHWQDDGHHADDVQRHRTLEVVRDGELGDADRQRDRRQHPIDAPGTSHAALPSGRCARSDWPPSRAPAMVSSPP